MNATGPDLTPSKAALLVFPIDPLPDFLTDHTLAGKHPPERLREYAGRWVQLAGSLWGWCNRATFALRFVARSGRVQAFLLARASGAGEAARLRGDLMALLRAHRLDEGSRGSLPSEAEFLAETALPGMVIAEVEQLEKRDLWQASPALLNRYRHQGPWQKLAQTEFSQPRVVYPWWGPGGPFLLPMESLVSQQVGISLTVYLAPTELKAIEREWLAFMAREAMSKGEHTDRSLDTGATLREVDPSASLAGRLYMANLRRLSAAPFLVSVHCAAADGNSDAALSLASAVQTLVHEPAFERPQQEDDRLPSGAKVDLPGNQSECLAQYLGLQFPATAEDDPVGRLPWLVDAQGAATIFRLPVSVRGGVPGMRVRQLSPDFHPGPRQRECPADHISLGEYHSGGGAYVPIRDLTKHTLVTGFTGSGKTVTVLQMLHQLWEKGVPFLVLESAKQEYRGLIGVGEFCKDLRIYTLGNEKCAPFRLNPFELLPGVRVEAHLGKLQTCFEGAIPPIGPSSSVIAKALLLAYEEKGWRLTDICPKEGTPERGFPVLREFVEKVAFVIEGRKYQGEVRDNLIAALVGRFEPLLIGSKGTMFDTQRCLPTPAELFGKPVILEMNDLVIEDKALMVMFILTLLREHREMNRSTDGSLKHITMVEEAHNVLEDVGSAGSGEGATQADTRYKAVQAFCGLLTEIRALGEGLIIADQSPVKLARDAMRNTNLQIGHQLRDGHDRDAIANAMIMEEEQRDFLGKLPPGHAAIFRTGLEKATFIKVDPYYPGKQDLAKEPQDKRSEAWTDWAKPFRGLGFKTLVEDEEVRTRMDELEPRLKDARKLSLPFAECQLCASQCLFRDAMFTASKGTEAQRAVKDWFELKRSDIPGTAMERWHFKWNKAVEFTASLVSRSGRTPTLDEVWCLFVHLHDWDVRRREGSRIDEVLDADHRALFANWMAGRDGPIVAGGNP